MFYIIKLLFKKKKKKKIKLITQMIELHIKILVDNKLKSIIRIVFCNFSSCNLSLILPSFDKQPSTREFLIDQYF